MCRRIFLQVSTGQVGTGQIGLEQRCARTLRQCRRNGRACQQRNRAGDAGMLARTLRPLLTVRWAPECHPREGATGSWRPQCGPLARRRRTRRGALRPHHRVARCAAPPSRWPSARAGTSMSGTRTASVDALLDDRADRGIAASAMLRRHADYLTHAATLPAVRRRPVDMAVRPTSNPLHARSVGIVRVRNAGYTVA